MDLFYFNTQNKIALSFLNKSFLSYSSKQHQRRKSLIKFHFQLAPSTEMYVCFDLKQMFLWLQNYSELDTVSLDNKLKQIFPRAQVQPVPH